MTMPAPKMKVHEERDDETGTTDAGSTCSSDGESVVSTASLSARSTGPLGLPRKSSKIGSRRGSFGGTELETIPGTPIAATYLESGSVFSFPIPADSAKPTREQTSDSEFPHECLADESESEEARVSTEDLDGSGGNHTMPFPLPRTPDSTMPILRSGKKRSRQAAVSLQERHPTITSVMHGSLSTSPILTRPRSPKRRTPQANVLAVMSDGEKSGTSSAKGIFGTVPALLPQSPKKRAREALFASAKRDGVPLKVKISGPPEAGLRKSLNPAVPVKKMPVFAEIAGPEVAAALRRLEPGMPVKKCVPSFLLDEPPRALCPPPGLTCLAR